MSKVGFHVDKNTQITKDLQRVKGDVKKLRNEKLTQAEKDTDEVMRAGQEDRTKAIKEIESIEIANQKESQKMHEDKLNVLDSKKRFYQSYKEQLAKTLSEILGVLDWVRGWQADVVVTDGGGITIRGKHFQTQDGVLLIVYKPDGAILHQGMLVIQEPALDYAKLYDIAMKVENEMDKARGLLMTSSSNGDASAILGANGRPITKPATQPAP